MCSGLCARVFSELTWRLKVSFIIRLVCPCIKPQRYRSRNNNIPEIFSGVHCVTGKTVSVYFRGIMKLSQRPHKSPLGIKFKFYDEHLLPFHMRAFQVKNDVHFC